MTALTVAFDYTGMEPALAAEAKQVAQRIRDRLNKSMIDTGVDLLLMKERLGHGHFGNWLAAEFQMSSRTAERYMAAAQLALKYDTVSDLPPAVLHVLAAPSASPAVINETLSTITNGAPAPEIGQLKKRMADAFAAQRKAAADAKKTPAEREAAKVRQAKHDARIARMNKKDDDALHKQHALSEAKARALAQLLADSLTPNDLLRVADLLDADWSLTLNMLHGAVRAAAEHALAAAGVPA